LRFLALPALLATIPLAQSSSVLLVEKKIYLPVAMPTAAATHDNGPLAVADAGVRIDQQVLAIVAVDVHGHHRLSGASLWKHGGPTIL
jgi:hypothetical protein